MKVLTFLRYLQGVSSCLIEGQFYVLRNIQNKLRRGWHFSKDHSKPNQPASGSKMVKNQICGATALKSQERLKQLLPNGSTVVSKALYLNLNFSFLNQILLLLISSNYPITLTSLDGPCSRPYTSRKFIRYSQESNPGPLGWQSNVLTTILNRWSSHTSTA